MEVGTVHQPSLHSFSQNPHLRRVLNRLICLCLFLVTLTIGAGCATSAKSRLDITSDIPRSTLNEAGRDYVTIIGDGYSVGEGRTGADPKAWPSLIIPQLREQGVTVESNTYASISSGYVDHDKGGRTFTDLVERMVGTKTKLVVVFGGDRDTTALPYGTVLQDSVRSTFQKVRELGPKADLLVIGPAFIGPPTPDVLRVRDIVRAESAAAGAQFVDPLSERWLADNPKLAGKVRLNESGQAYLANKIAPLIAERLHVAGTR